MRNNILHLGAWLCVLPFATPSALRAQTYTVIDIGALRSGSTIAEKINLGGEIVGNSGTLYGANNRAFIRTASTLLNLGTLAAGDSSSAFDINKRGTVVGDSNTATVIRAFLWDATSGMQDLGTLPGDTGSRAFGGCGLLVGQLWRSACLPMDIRQRDAGLGDSAGRQHERGSQDQRSWRRDRYLHWT